MAKSRVTVNTESEPTMWCRTIFKCGVQRRKVLFNRLYWITGNIKALSEGNATITATADNGVFGTCKVLVEDFIPTNTPTPIPTNTPIPTDTPTPVPTDTPVPPAEDSADAGESDNFKNKDKEVDPLLYAIPLCVVSAGAAVAAGIMTARIKKRRRKENHD